MLLASVSVGDFAFESDADSHWKPVVPKLNYDLRRLSLIYSQMFEALKKSALIYQKLQNGTLIQNIPSRETEITILNLAVNK